MTTIGVPREVKNRESRVGLTPDAVGILVADGHRVLVERGAGIGSDFADTEYASMGAEIVDVDSVFDGADLVVKVKEPQPAEVARLKPSQMIFTFLHLAGEPDLAAALLQRGVTAIAYETVTTPDGRLPLLAPMSAIAGRLAAQIAAHLMESPSGGRGKLMGGIPGVERTSVTIIGAGVVGTNAAYAAVGLGADVTVLDIQPAALERIEAATGGRVRTLVSGPRVLDRCLSTADVVVGAASIPGARAPVILRRSHLELLPTGAIFVDLAIDQGGSAETSRVTSHDAPTYVDGGTVHYCVPNVPALVPRTATIALANATLAYVRMVAGRGIVALMEGGPVASGLNLFQGEVMNATVAEALRTPVDGHN
ncbi:MAG: alanine dehydrogenase [Dehalococcoidia bacterium]|nr:alanine dehydrogenase [Dehalococcoidia bacterium]